jgi:glycosyl transferase family 1
MRILLATEYSPYDINFGAQQRSHVLWRALSEFADVDVILLRRGRTTAVHASSDPRLAAEATFRVAGFGSTYVPDRQLSRLLDEQVGLDRYDVICGRLVPLTKLDIPPGVASVVDLDDIGYSYASRRGAIARTAAIGKTAVRHWLEGWALRRFSRYWFVSERDRSRFPALDGDVLPNIPVLDGGVPTASKGHRLVFVGALWYPPNREGVARFVQLCWPAIRRANPDARLDLIGGVETADRAQWNRADGVSARGFVKDITAAYCNAAFTIAPVYSGGGTNIKILESLVHGRACATTKYCLDRFRPHFDGETDVLAARDDSQMIENCTRLLREPALREATARNGHEIVAKEFNYGVVRRAVRRQIQLATEGQGVRWS